MKVGLFVIGIGLIAVTLLSEVRSARWWIRAADFPRLQIAVLLALVAAAGAVTLEATSPADIAFALAVLTSLVYQTARVVPYTPLWPRQVLDAAPSDDGRLIRILISNVLMENRRADDFLALVSETNPDLILALETDGWWDERLGPLEGGYPHVVKRPQGNHYGMHIFSRLDLAAPEVRFLVDDDVPSIRTEVRLPSGESIVFIGLHPRPPEPRQDTEERDAELLIVGREVKACGRPAIVAGDLNDVAWSHTTRLFQRIGGMLDPRRGRGMFSTFHADYPYLRWPLDHVFHDSSFRLVRLQRLRTIGSDHFPVLAELRYDPPAEEEQAEPEATPQDAREASEQIAEGRAANQQAPGGRGRARPEGRPVPTARPGAGVAG